MNITSPYMNDASNRWLPGMSNEQHHKMRCISSSQVKYYSQYSPYAFYKKYVARSLPKQKITENLLTGTLLHLLVLEPEKYAQQIMICDIDQRTKKYKDFLKDNFGTETPEEGSGGGLVRMNGEVKEEIYLLKTENENPLKKMAESINNHKRASLMLSSCDSELSGIAQDPETFLFLSLRADKVDRKDGYFIDLKTCSSVNIRDVQNQLFSFGYYFQHAHYLHTANLIQPNTFHHFYFLFICKEPPYECVLVHLDEDSIAFAERRHREVLTAIRNHELQGGWYPLDKSDGIILSLPSWALR